MYAIRSYYDSQSSLKAGDTVTKNTIIGYEGTTGTSTGYHLHLDVNTLGRWYNTSDPNTAFNTSNTINPESLFSNISFTHNQ